MILKIVKIKLSFFVTLILIVGFLVTTSVVFAQIQHFSQSAEVSVAIGNPPTNCPRGWPVTGSVTQGPDGASSHGDNSPTPGNEALDIGTSLGTPVYATLTGTVIASYSINTLNQSIIIAPNGSCIHQRTGRRLTQVHFHHLSERRFNNGDLVNFGQQIGRSGQAGSGPHVHYQFNETATLAQGGRQFPIEPPYIPTAVPRACDSAAACDVSTTAPPQ